MSFNGRVSKINELSLAQRLKRNKSSPLILDGPTGTELAARGFEVDRPGWSARALVEAPELLLEVQKDYVKAGAQILTANTFRTHEQNLGKWGQQGRSKELTIQAVCIARQAAKGKAYVVGSLAPLGDCYSPEETPPKSQMVHSHHRMVQHLADAKVDAVLVETHASCEELEIASQAAFEQGLALIVSLSLNSENTMYDGTPIKRALAGIAGFSPLAIGMNCLPVEQVHSALDEMNAISDLPKIVYANSGRLLSSGIWEQTEGANFDQHLELAKSWIKNNVRILGGCCGTSPALIAKFTETFQSQISWEYS